MSWRIVKNEPLIGHVFDHEVILVAMNVNNSFSNGFRCEVARCFPSVVEADSAEPYGDRRRFGTVKVCETDGLTFALCYMYTVQNRRKDTVDSVKYDALSECLAEVDRLFCGRNIGCQLIGTDVFDGNGDKTRIAKIFMDSLKDCDVTIYDYVQRDVCLDDYRRMSELKRRRKDGEITGEEYAVLRGRLEWEMKHGIYSKVPDGYMYKKKTN